MWVRLSILNLTVIFKIFGKTTATVMWEKQPFRVTHSAVHLRHFCGCDAAFVGFEVQILVLLLLRVSPQYFLEVFCEQFPHSVEEASF